MLHPAFLAGDEQLPQDIQHGASAREQACWHVKRTDDGATGTEGGRAGAAQAGHPVAQVEGAARQRRRHLPRRRTTPQSKVHTRTNAGMTRSHRRKPERPTVVVQQGCQPQTAAPWYICHSVCNCTAASRVTIQMLS